MLEFLFGFCLLCMALWPFLWFFCCVGFFFFINVVLVLQVVGEKEGMFMTIPLALFLFDGTHS